MAFVVADGATLLLASHFSALRISLQAARWDFWTESFIQYSEIHMPVSGDVELLTGNSVLDCETGLFQCYLVIRRESFLLVGYVDWEEEDFKTVAELSLTPLLNCNSSSVADILEDCWLANGPVIMLSCKGRLLVAYKQYSDSSLGSLTEFRGDKKIVPICQNEYRWHTHILRTDDPHHKRHAKIHFYGNLKRGMHPELILSTASHKSQEQSPFSKESHPSWSYFCLSVNGYGPSVIMNPVVNAVDHSNLHIEWRRCGLIPRDLDPKLITCVWPLLVAPGSEDSAVDVFMGTSDRKLLRCRNGLISDALDLADTPVELHYAGMSEGQGVMVVVLKDAEQSALAIDVENHKILQVWKRVCKVIVGDFALMGHDQIAVLRNTSTTLKECGSLMSSYNLLDFTLIKEFSISTLLTQTAPEVKASTEHKVSCFGGIVKSLQLRIEAGESELSLAKRQRQTKKNLLQVACQVMQDSVAQHSLLDCGTADGNINFQNSLLDENRLLTQITGLQQMMCQSVWFLTVDVQRLPVRDNIILQDISLLLATLNGTIYGKSSVQKHLLPEDGIKHITVSVAVQNIPFIPNLHVDVILRAAVVSRGRWLHEGCEASVDGCEQIYTQWLCKCEVTFLSPSRCIEPKLATAVCEKQQFVVAANNSVHLEKLEALVKSMMQGVGEKKSAAMAVSDKEISDVEQHNEKEFEITCVTGLGWASISTLYFNKSAFITLQTVNTHLMALLQHSLRTLLLQHQFQLLPRRNYQDSLNTANYFVDSFVEEISLSNSWWQRKHDEKCRSHRKGRCHDCTLSAVRKHHLATERAFSRLLFFWL